MKLTTSRVPDSTIARPLDERVVLELLNNASDNIRLDFAIAVGGPLIALAVTAFLEQLGTVGYVIVFGGAVFSAVVALKLAIRRRRRRCRELGVDPDEVDRLFRRVDLFRNVVFYNRLTAEQKQELVKGILAKEFV